MVVGIGHKARWGMKRADGRKAKDLEIEVRRTFTGE